MGSSSLMIASFLIVLVSLLMVLDFFGANITDDYVEGNMEYADEYMKVLNNNFSAGYVSLSRLLYFYLDSSNLTLDQIYKDNIDIELKQIKPISSVCLLSNYKHLNNCKNIDSGQINDIQNKPFIKPVDFVNVTITSFFMHERIIYGTYDIHTGVDFAKSAQSPIYSACEGTIVKKKFPYLENTIDKKGGGGNQLTIECEIDGDVYNVIYAHLYPLSSSQNVGEKVLKGELIATVGTTGYSTGNHLHFEVRKNGVLVDGLSLIDFN